MTDNLDTRSNQSIAISFSELKLPKRRNENAQTTALLARKYTDPTAPPDDACLLTLREAAYILRVSYKTLFNLTRRKQNAPPSIRIGKYSPRFPRDDFMKWVHNQGR
jgi:hypothetical protein